MTPGDLRWIQNWKPKGYITNMNKFYRKPKPETMKKNREFYAETFEKEIKWLKDNVSVLTQFKNKFLLEMYARWLKDFIKVEYGKNVEDYDWSNIK